MEKAFFTSKEVAALYRCKVATVHRWVRSGRLTAINLGGNRRGPYIFRREDLDAFIQKALVGQQPGKKVAG